MCLGYTINIGFLGLRTILTSSVLCFKFKLPRNKRLMSMIGISSAIRVSCDVIIFLCSFWRFEDVSEERVRMPCPPPSSSHPWSRVFNIRAPVLRGALIINWEDSGARNHIMQEAALKLVMVLREAVFIVNILVFCQNKNAPVKVTIIVRSFRWSGRNISSCGVRISQFRADPPAIAVMAKNVEGRDNIMSSLFTLCIGREQEGAHIVAIRNRIVYEAVSPVARKNKKIIIVFVGLNKVNSKIMSFE